ncbi:MAG TPA: prolyl oligopeptidase family serine peptidase, partial [Thermoanaerobaculia bacterium]|nr:prolyl oligopeptidase family serine peptidase [Thermoanaerobaculia bacterium]
SRVLNCLVVSLLVAAPAGAVSPAPTAFTLEQVLSAPFPTELTADPATGAFAWVFNDRGARNIWVAEPPDYRGRAVTAYSEDDGQEILDAAFAPGGKSVVYVRGGGANRRGENPNPLSRPEGIEQAIFVVPLSGGEPRRLAEGHSPAVSRVGDVAYVFKEQIWSVRIEGSEKPVPLIKARGEAGALRWSPDGSRLAFASRRGDHSFVGVYDPSGKRLTYLDPSVDRDSGPVWSPDGKRVAFLRIPASREIQSFRPHREGPPWSIRVAEAATGQAREVFRAEKGRGSVFRNVVAENQLLWADGDRIVFPWERDGWTHLYSVPAAGGPATLLTPGDFEVEYVSLAPDRKRVLFNSNQGDIDRRHLWSVSPAGGTPAALTDGKGIEWSPVATGDGRTIAYFRSDARVPPQPAVMSAGSPARPLTARALPPGDFPQGMLVVPEQVIFPAVDGMKIHGQLFLPRDPRPGEKRPAAIFFHGGSRRQMLLGWHYNYYYRNSYAFNQYLASRGYVVLSINYRSGIGYGMEFREALEYGAAGGSEYNDVVGAGRYLQARPDVDGRRIALWGGSYGGYLTALGLARNSDMFAAGVDFHGVHDWNDVITNFEPSYDPLKRQEVARVAFESSPLSSVKSWRSPVLLIHGDDDRNVPFTESVDLAEALRKNGVEFEELIFPDEIHDFLIHAHWLAAYRAAADFLNRRLEAGPRSKVQSPR